jgi:multidrug efflux pump subunit AcrA (membrane-fusion protein)
MRWRSLLAASLIVVGIGAVGLVVLGPVGGATPASQYLTTAATRTNVVQSAVATGAIAAQSTYGLAFGRDPSLTSGSSASSSSSSSNSSSSNSSSSSGSTASWTVTGVEVQAGDHVTKGQLLATADDSKARLQLAVAQANLASALARLAGDQAGATAADDAAALNSLNQAKAQLTAARANRLLSARQSQASIARAQSALSSAQKQLASDKGAKKDPPTIAVDEATLAAAQQALDTAQLDATASVNQSTSSVNSAQLDITAAEDAYNTRTERAPSAQIAGDRGGVANASSSAASAAATLAGARIAAPADGVVVAVNVSPGIDAPSGDAIQLQAGGMQVTAEFSESDLPTLAVNQPATVTVTALGLNLTGKVAQILPVASTSGNSSVVTYAVVISLSDAPSQVKAGMSASVSVATATATNVIAVPAIALSGANGNYSVRVLTASGQVEVRQVEVGLTTSSLAEIKSGLNAGEEVVTGSATARQNTTTGTGAGGFGAFPVGGGGGRNNRPGGATQP